jgi:branched-chain amino acid transport system permease protein
MMPEENTLYCIELLINGVLAGAIYALVSLAFVVVYKASRMINFALGEWVMVASNLVSAGLHVLGLGLFGAIGFGMAGMVGLAVGFNRLVLHRLIGRPVITFIMVTIGLGIVLRALAVFVFTGIPGSITLPITEEPITIQGVLLSVDELVAAGIAIICIAMISWFFQCSRTGVALRAVADDQQAAMVVGIDVNRHFAIAWALAGLIAVIAGTLWTFISGGGFGLLLVGLKVFPIVFIGGLDSIPGVIIGAIFIGLLESVMAGYIDPIVGGGFSSIASYFVLVTVLFIRPYGLFGGPDIERV